MVEIKSKYFKEFWINEFFKYKKGKLKKDERRILIRLDRLVYKGRFSLFSPSYKSVDIFFKRYKEKKRLTIAYSIIYELYLFLLLSGKTKKRIVRHIHYAFGHCSFKIENRYKNYFHTELSEKEFIGAYTRAKELHTRLIMSLAFNGLTRKEISELRTSQIINDYKSIFLKIENLNTSSFFSKKKHRILKYSNETEKLLRKRLSFFEIEIDDCYKYDIKIFGQLGTQGYLKEILKIAKIYGYPSSESFLKDIRSLFISKLHRRGVPPVICMDYMNIQSFEQYMFAIQTNNLKTDQAFIERALNEVFNYE